MKEKKMNANKLQRIEPQSLALESRQPDDANPMSIIQFALEKGAGVEVIEKMMNVRRELRAEQAKRAFDESMAAFQLECPVIAKRKQVMNKDGRSVRYKFAPIDDIIIQVKTPLKNHGFSYTLNAEIITGTPMMVKAVCLITHQGGHAQTSEFQVPIDKDAYMSAPQQFAAALTFAKRYAFCNGFGIITGDDDTDAAPRRTDPPSPKKQTSEEQLKALKGTLWTISAPFRGSESNWLAIESQLRVWKILDARTIAQLSADDLSEVIGKTQIQLNPEDQ